jgi:hypothetical protein
MAANTWRKNTERGVNMREELDNALCQKYPKIFVNRGADMKESCMYWGFSCGDGWYDLLDRLCESIQSYIDNNSTEKNPIPQLVAEQVKEKFGTLRFYTSGGDRLIDGMIWFAESMSGSTCEECGNKGKRSNTGWIRTLCTEHTKENNEGSTMQ